MMKTIASAIALCLAASAAQAAEGAWNSAGSAGTYEYSVTNRDGATQCSEYQPARSHSPPISEHPQCARTPSPCAAS